MRKRILVAIVCILTAVLRLPSLSLAQGVDNGAGFMLSPAPAKDPSITSKGYFVYKLEPGALVTGQVLIQNPSERTITIELSPVDAQTAQGGGSAYAPSGSKPTAIATWLKLRETRVTLPAKRQKTVGFSVQAPPTIRPGQYLAGITAYVPNTASGAAKRGSNQAGASVDVQTRYVIGVQVDVPGVRSASLVIPSVSLVRQPSGTFYGIKIRNNGGLFVKPQGSASLYDSNGKRLLLTPIKMETFVTGTEVVYPVKWPGQPAPGKYKVEVRLAYAPKKVATYSGAILVDAVAKFGAEAAQSNLQADASSDGDAPEAAGQLSDNGARGVQGWVFYATGGVLLLLVALLSLSLLRIRAGHRREQRGAE